MAFSADTTKESLIFREIKEGEVPLMFQMILDRMRWMDEVGIKQWNVTAYDEVYPLKYYEEKRQRGEAFVMEDSEGKILCAAVLKSEDERWEDKSPALYLRNFVTALDSCGAGKFFMEFAEDYARSLGKTYFRLDSATDNERLAKYYEEKGYTPAGFCVDGEYEGILREKRL